MSILHPLSAKRWNNCGFYRCAEQTTNSQTFGTGIGFGTRIIPKVGKGTSIPSIILVLSISLGAQESKPFPASVPTTTQVERDSSRFDVVSIKPSAPENLGLAMLSDPPNAFTMKGATFKTLLLYAFHLHPYQVEGLPSWCNSTRFDVVTKMDLLPSDTSASKPSHPEADQRLFDIRLQNVLRDRFGLRLHASSKIAAMYSLRPIKSPIKMSPSVVDTGSRTGNGFLSWSKASMADLADTLSDYLDRVVRDETAIPGTYVISLKWSIDDAAQSEDNALPSLFTAIQEQLGLKLVSTKGPVETLIVDQLHLPTSN